MAVFKVRKIRRGLRTKLEAEEESSRHLTYRIFDDDGIFLGETYISHGATEVGDPLLGQMAKELNISLALWKDIVRCPKGRAEYVVEASQ